LAALQFAISRRRVVPIARLLQKASFGPGEVNVLVRATGRTDEIAHFVMAITAAEAMAHHVFVARENSNAADRRAPRV
jgi:hypothetical protein